MDLQLTIYILTLLFLPLILLLRFFNGQKTPKAQNSVKKLPPGPVKLPFIGNMLHFLGSKPHYAIKDLAKKYGDIIHLQLGEIPIVVISSSKMVETVFKTHDLALADRMETLGSKILFYDGSDIAFACYGDYWRQMRKICIVELLSVKMVRSFSSIREDEVGNLISSIQASSGLPVNLTEKIFAMTSAITCRAAFGKKYEGKDVMTALVKELAVLVGGFNIADLFPSLKFLPIINGMRSKLVRMHNKLDEVLERIIDEHEENRASRKATKEESREEDLVDVLLRLRDSGDLDFSIDKKSIKGVIFDMFSAGTETSSSTLEWAMTELIRNPRVIQKAQAEVRQLFKDKKKVSETDIQGLNYLKLVIKETLRLHPPIPLLLPRECREECEINGYRIPVKTKFMVNVWAIGRDPKYWPNAEKFEPERFENGSIDFVGSHYEYLPFGGGRRICPGMNFALASMTLPLAKLLYHFDWKLPGNLGVQDLDMTETDSPVNGSRKYNLHVVTTPYAPLDQ